VTTKSNPRWYQVSLRTILILVTCLCLALGVYVQRVSRQQETVKAVRAANGGVHYDSTGWPLLGKTHSRYLADVLGNDFVYFAESVTVCDRRLLGRIAELPGVRSLTVEDSNLCDEDLALIANMHSLESVSLFGDDRNIIHFSHDWPSIGPAEVTILYDSNRLTDKSFVTLTRLANLRSISISGQRYSEAGVHRLLEKPKLEELHLCAADNSATKSWLTSYATASRLKIVTLTGSDFSVEMSGGKIIDIDHMASWRQWKPEPSPGRGAVSE
jgi:hypothetical protein